MMCYNRFHPFAFVIEMGEEMALLLHISQLMQDIYLPFFGGGVSDFSSQ